MYDPDGVTRSPEFSIPTRMKPSVPGDLTFDKSFAPSREYTGTVAALGVDADALAMLADVAAE
jgi:hypothetical protein